MRVLGPLLVAGVTMVQAPGAQAPSQVPSAQTPEAQASSTKPVGTIAELMLRIIYPTSDAFFYISRGLPKTQAKWEELQGKALMLAEAANLLMMPGRAMDQDRWVKDAKLLRDVGELAFKASMAKNGKALNALSDQLLAACDTCHTDYRPPEADADPAPPRPRRR